MTSLQPLRTQYPFDLSGVRFRSRSDILTMQRQWETFERIENYNDIIFQQFSVGNFGKTYYQFRDQTERSDYRVGQLLHINRYPELPPSTFDSISNRPLPVVSTITAPLPNYTFSPSPLAYIPAAIPESVNTAKAADLAIYANVSTFNASHYFKYNFVSDDERIAYHRGERYVRMGLS